MQYPALICRHPGVITVLVAQGGTATVGATMQLFPMDSVFKRIIYARSTKSWDYIVRSSLVQFVILKNTFTFGCWRHYMLTLTIPWCYVITLEWWFHVHFIHAGDFSLLTKPNLMHIALLSNGALAFFVLILTFSSVSVIYSVVFLRFYLFMRYCTKRL